MSINVNPAISGVNWEALLQQVDNIAKASKTGEKPVLTFSTTEADGSPRTVQVNIPNDLELPGTVDQPAIDSLCAKLTANPDLGVSGEQVQQLHTQMSNALKSEDVQTTLTSMQDSGRVMFDLYKLMALLVEVAQKQREAARGLRETESQLEQTSILNQADQQRTDAMTAMIASAICCAIQVGAMTVSLYKQADAYTDQLTANQSSGLNSARENLSMLETAETTEGADEQLESTKVAVGEDTANAVSESFAAKPNAALEEAKVAEANLKETTARQQRLLDFDKELAAEDVKNDASLKSAQERLSAFDRAKELEALKADGKLDEAGAKELDGLHEQLDSYAVEKSKADYAKVSAEEVVGEKASPEAKADALKASQERYDAAKQMEELSKPAAEEKAPEESAKAAKTDAAEAPKAGKADGEEAAEAGKKAPTADELRGKLYGFAKEQAEAELKQARTAAANKLDKPIEEAKANYEKLRTAANKEIDATLKTYEDAYDSALGARSNVDPAASDETVAKLDDRLQTAEDNLKFARAKAAQMRSGITTPEERQMLIEKAKARVTEARQNLQTDLTYVKAGNTLHRLEGINTLISTVGNCVQGLIQQGNAMNQSEITKEGATQKKEEAQIDDMKDLFNQAGDLVKSVLQLMAAVGNAESQSIRDAIQA